MAFDALETFVLHWNDKLISVVAARYKTCEDLLELRKRLLRLA